MSEFPDHVLSARNPAAPSRIRSPISVGLYQNSHNFREPSAAEPSGVSIVKDVGSNRRRSGCAIERRKGLWSDAKPITRNTNLAKRTQAWGLASSKLTERTQLPSPAIANRANEPSRGLLVIANRAERTQARCPASSKLTERTQIPRPEVANRANEPSRGLLVIANRAERTQPWDPANPKHDERTQPAFTRPRKRDERTQPSGHTTTQFDERTQSWDGAIAKCSERTQHAQRIRQNGPIRKSVPCISY
jgi:hypothetical protein